MSSDATTSPRHDPLRAVQQHVQQQWHQVQQHWQQHVVPALHNVQAVVHDALATHPLAAHIQRSSAAPTRSCFATISAPASPSTPPEDDQQSTTNFTPKEEAELRAYIETLTDEEREQWASELWESLLKDTKVKVNGKRTSLWQLKEEEEAAEAAEEANLGENEKRDIPPYMRMDEVDSKLLRQDKVKPQLFEEEEEALDLVRMSMGFVWQNTPVPWLTRRLGWADIQFGIFADPKAVAKHMGEDWAGEDPKEVIRDDRFYTHALACVPEIQATLLAVPARNLPVQQATDRMIDMVRQRLQRSPEGVTAEDEATLAEMRRIFSVSKLKASGLLEGNNYKEGGHFFFTALPNGNLAAEAITPGVIRDQQQVQLAVFCNPKVTYAVMEMVLGQDPIDPLARLNAGNNLLYAANGFTFNRSEAVTPDNWTAPVGDVWPEVEVGTVNPTPDVFSYDVRARKRVFKTIKYGLGGDVHKKNVVNTFSTQEQKAAQVSSY